MSEPQYRERVLPGGRRQKLRIIDGAVAGAARARRSLVPATDERVEIAGREFLVVASVSADVVVGRRRAERRGLERLLVVRRPRGAVLLAWKQVDGRAVLL